MGLDSCPAENLTTKFPLADVESWSGAAPGSFTGELADKLILTLTLTLTLTRALPIDLKKPSRALHQNLLRKLHYQRRTGATHGVGRLTHVPMIRP